MEQADVEKLIGELDLAVDRTRSLYEQYFMGIERLEPTIPRKDVDRRIQMLRKEQIRNTALRFRFQMLLQRYNTYQSHWQRICRDIENGTYKRHVIRAQQRFGSDGKRASAPAPIAPAPERSLAAELADLDREFAPAEMLDDRDVELEEEAPTVRRGSVTSRPRLGPVTRTPLLPPRPGAGFRIPAPNGPPSPPHAAAAPTAVPARPSPRATTAGQHPELPDTRIRQLYAQYIEVKRRQNESTAAITYEAVARSLRESSAKLRGRHGKAVDFEVAVKDGRAIIRPVLK